MSLRIRQIQHAKDFMALAPLWGRLASESGQTSPFLSHDWFWCCWHAVWPHRHPEILLLEEAGTPVAIIPLMSWRERLCGLSVRCLGLLECPISPMVDMLMLGDHGRVRILETFLDYLATRWDWDTIRLQKLPTTSPTLQILQAILPGRLPWQRTGTVVSPSLTIAMDWEDFYRAKSPHLKKLCRQMQDQLEGIDHLSVEEHGAVALGSPLLSEVIAITRGSWRAGRATPLATMPRMPEFLRELTRRATKNGWLSLWLLRLSGRVVAMEYQFRDDGTVYTLYADDDPTYQALSPGRLLKFAIIRALHERGGVREYDMGAGLSDEKLRWATASRETVHLKLYRPRLYARLLYGMETLVVPAAQM